jgi:hypothetical protein
MCCSGFGLTGIRCDSSVVCGRELENGTGGACRAAK